MHALGECFDGLSVGTALNVCPQDLLVLSLQRGDRLRGEAGSLWLTVDGRLEDVVLAPGEVHLVERDGPVNLTALRAGRLSVLGRRPLRWRQAGASHAAWRSRARRMWAWLVQPPQTSRAVSTTSASF
jgi:hypothetical protein